MKSLRLSLILFCAFIGSAFAVQSIDQPFSELKLTDGRVLENARLKAFNSDSVFVRDDDGFVQVPYNLFPGELQPQLSKARAASTAPSGVSSDRGDTPPPSPTIARPSVVTSQPFPYETLGLANGCFIESVCFYDRFQETYGTDPWVRVLQWGAKEEDQSVSGHAVAVFELQGQLWAWDINFGFMPLDVPPDSKENLGLVVPPIVARYPNIVSYSPMYRQDFPQQPEANLPEAQSTSDIPAIRDATLAGARVGLHRPVNVLQFSYLDASGATQQSAATAFLFNGKVCIYFPDRGTVRFIMHPRSIVNLQELHQAFRWVYPSAFALKSLNYTGSAPVNADAQN